MRFEEQPRPTPRHADWRPWVEQFAAQAKSRNLRISHAIGAALQKSPRPRADRFRPQPRFLRAIEVAAHIGVRTVAGFPGAVIELHTDPRGGNPTYKPFENFLPRLLEFWEPVARVAADSGVHASPSSTVAPWADSLSTCRSMGFKHARPARHVGTFRFNETKCPNLGLEWDPSHPRLPVD